MSELDNQATAINEQVDVDPDDAVFNDTGSDYTDPNEGGAPAQATPPEDATIEETAEEGGDYEDEEVDEIKPQKPHNKRPGYYARINQEQRRRDAEMEQLRQQNALLLQQMQANQPQQPVDEETRQAQQIAEFVKSLAAEEIKKELAPLKQQEQQRAMEAEKRKFDAELNKAGKRYSDFDDVVRYNPDLIQDANIVAAAQLLPNCPDVLYHLGRNEEALYEIKYLPPIEQAKRIAKIGIDIAMRQAQKRTTQAPAPLSKGSAGIKQPTGSKKTLNTMNANDLMAEAKNW
jgi:hypothetical protein